MSNGAVWVANTYSDTISRIDAGENRVTAEIAFGNGPAGVAVAPGGIWISSRAGAAAHHGGTLRVVTSPETIDSLDPALAYLPTSWQVVSITNDGLVGFKRASGIEGGTLVPDLAVSLPKPSDGGKTYTFQLREGVRYSNGAPVRVGDVRRGLERNYRLKGPGAPYYSGIVGSEACAKRPARCVLSRGIVSDDAAGTVTFHLTAPDPEFCQPVQARAPVRGGGARAHRRGAAAGNRAVPGRPLPAWPDARP